MNYSASPYVIIDGDENALAIKAGDNIHAVSWSNCRVCEGIDTVCHGRIDRCVEMNVMMAKILKAVKIPISTLYYGKKQFKRFSINPILNNWALTQELSFWIGEKKLPSS